MQTLTPQDQQAILAVALVVMLVFGSIDIAILVQWVKYLNLMNAYNRRFRFTPPVPASYTGTETEVSNGQPDFLVPEIPPLELAEIGEEPDNKLAQADVPVDHVPFLPATFSGAAEMEVSAAPVSPFAPVWSLVHPFVAFQAVMGAVVLFTVFALIPTYVTGSTNPVGSAYAMAVTILGLVLQNVGFVGITGYLVHRYGTNLKSIGLRAPKPREIILGASLGVALLLAAGALEKVVDIGAHHLLSKAFIDKIDHISAATSAGGMFEDIQSHGLKLCFALAGAIAAPIGEEVFFRGLLYNALKHRWGIKIAVLLSAICFALSHGSPLSVVIIIPMGLVLAIAYEKTGSLWVTISMHAVNNGAAFLISSMAATPPHH